MTPRPITDLWKTPAPGRVVVLGKGPSLEEYRPEGYANDVVVGLNEVCETYRCDFMVYVDNRMQNVKVPEGTLPLRQKGQRRQHDGRGYVWSSGIDIEKGHGGGYTL